MIIDTLGEYGTGRKVVTSPSELIFELKKTRFDVAVQFPDAIDGFDWACRAAYAVGNMLLLVEEADFYIKAGSAPQCFSLLVRYGRHRGVEMICISRRPPDLWRNLTANSDQLYCFRSHEPRDIKYLSAYMGKAAEMLPHLKPFHYLQYDNGIIKNGKL